MEFSGGEVAAKRSHPGGEDRLSTLPDDALVLILLRLDTDTAGRTSVLSRRWRHVWTLLPVLRFLDGTDPHRIRAALSNHQAALHYLHVRSVDAIPASVAAWLSAASRRGTGRLVFQNMGVGRGSDDDGVEEAAFELPCLEKATSISLDLGFLVLALPPAGTFARLTELVLIKAWFHGPSALGDLVSSHRCPSLQKLIVRDAIGLLNLAIHSESLLQVELRHLIGLQQLIINAPVPKELKLPNNHFAQNQHTADLSAPQLVSLELSDPYVPSSIQLGNMPLLQRLTTSFFLVYGPEGFPSNYTILELLTRFWGIQDLTLNLAFPKVIGNDQYLMEDITMIPRISFLTLVVMNYGHAFGGSLLHVLKNCIGLRSLSLHFEGIQEEQFACPSGCICDQPINWKTDKLLLNCLQKSRNH
ncbi:hypothetical protein EJB05_13909 [Eragrostis curvula]|uniref:F-box domain-containing protein n=1 Tax=Eragrostis curvula TaxID=38414 RepID=A0A5J9VYM1_9POAL|nr:hypothetical protein EJB05_13909 [Eragrostis curvula]